MFFKKAREIGPALLFPIMTHTAAYYLGKSHPAKMEWNDQKWRYGFAVPSFILSVLSTDCKAIGIMMFFGFTFLASHAEGSHAAYVELNPETEPSPVAAMFRNF